MTHTERTSIMISKALAWRNKAASTSENTPEYIDALDNCLRIARNLIDDQNEETHLALKRIPHARIKLLMNAFSWAFTHKLLTLREDDFNKIMDKWWKCEEKEFEEAEEYPEFNPDFDPGNRPVDFVNANIYRREHNIAGFCGCDEEEMRWLLTLEYDFDYKFYSHILSFVTEQKDKNGNVYGVWETARYKR